MNTIPENFSEVDQAKFSPTKPTSPLPVTDVDQVLSDPMTFSEAINVVLQGGVVRRLEWTDSKVVVRIIGDTLAIFLNEDKDNPYDPLIVTTGDMLGKDWVRVLEE